MPHSHHSHSGQFCKHASGLLEHVVLEAIRQGFQTYGLTEHVPRYRLMDLYPEEDGLSISDLEVQFDLFLDEAHRLKSLYSSQIAILVGLETEYITSADLHGLKAILRKFGDRVEYIVGSVHHVNGIPIDFDNSAFERALHSFGIEDERGSQEALLLAYFDAQFEILQFKPEIIGHFDLCRLYNPKLRFQDYPSVIQRIQRNIQYAIEYGALFEINAGAFRKQWDTAYPGKDVIELIVQSGGRFALSDDSHGPHAVGLNYHRVFDYLQSVGVSEIWYLQISSQPNAAGRTVQPVKLNGDWQSSSFWHKLPST